MVALTTRCLFVVILTIALQTNCLAFQQPEDERKPVSVWCLDFSPDGSMLAAAAGDREGSGVVQVWSTADWKYVMSVADDRATTCTAFSPDKRSLGIGTQKGDVLIVDISSKKTIARWPSGKSSVFGMTWTPDSQAVVGACANGIIKVWDARTQDVKATFDIWKADGIVDPGLRGHSDRNQWDVAVSRDGKTLLSGGWNDTTRLWSMETQELLQQFGNEDKSIQGVKFTPDGSHFVSAGLGSGMVRIRETQSRRERLTLPVSGRDVAVHPDGLLIAASTHQDVQVYRVDLAAGQNEAGVPVKVLADFEGQVRQVAFSPDGKLIAASTMTGEVRVWTVPEFRPIKTTTVTIPW